MYGLVNIGLIQIEVEADGVAVAVRDAADNGGRGAGGVEGHQGRHVFSIGVRI